MEHSINPPTKLVQQWKRTAPHPSNETEHYQYITLCAAQWGADQELEACCEWFQEFYKTESWVKHDLKHFRAARRPKPPSLKEQALKTLHSMQIEPCVINRKGLDGVNTYADLMAKYDILRRALEALPND